MLNPKKYLAKVIKIKKYSDDIFSVIFKTSNNVNFKPGQFLHLTLDKYDPSDGYWPESRIFSIASEPNKDEVEIIYSVKGYYTKRMAEELYEGKDIWIKLPYGDFIIENHIKDCDNIFFIAGGTGISPFVSYLRNNKINGIQKLVLYYGIRSENLCFYKDLINKSIIEKHVIVGMLDIESISKRISETPNSKTFISGPLSMINSFRDSLVKK